MHTGLSNLCNNDLKTLNTTLHCMQVSQQEKALSGLIPRYPLLMQILLTLRFHLYIATTALGSNILFNFHLHFNTAPRA